MLASQGAAEAFRGSASGVHAMFRVSSKGFDLAVDTDSSIDSIDFGRAFGDRVRPKVRKEESGPMWGPGVKLQESSSKAFPQRFAVSQSSNAQPKTERTKGEEELDKFYATLPEEVFDLTLQDLVEKNKSQTDGSLREEEGVVQNALPAGKSSPVSEEGVKLDTGKVRKKDNKENGKVKHASKENKNSAVSFSIKIPAKVTGMLSPKSEFPPTRRDKVTPETLEKLLKKRQKQSSKREGLYSASTPTASRRVSPIASPQLSPRNSFCDYILPIERHSFESEFSKSPRCLSLNIEDRSGIRPGVGQSPRQSVSQTLSVLLESSTEGCSKCSPTKGILTSGCQVCGKNSPRRAVTIAAEHPSEGHKTQKNFVTKAEKKGWSLFNICRQVEVYDQATGPKKTQRS